MWLLLLRVLAFDRSSGSFARSFACCCRQFCLLATLLIIDAGWLLIIAGDAVVRFVGDGQGLVVMLVIVDHF